MNVRIPRPAGDQGDANDKLLLTIEEAARRLGIGRSHTYSYVLRGELESVKLGRSRRVPAQAINEFVKKLRAESVDPRP
jgi:excisionase family DNA binding protein